MRIGFITPPTDPDVSYCIPVLLILTNITYMNFQQAAAALLWHFQSSVSIATFCSLSFFYFFFIFLTTSIKIAIILLYLLHKASFCLYLFNTVSFLTQIEKACFYTIVHWSFFFLKINILSRKSYLCSLFLAREEESEIGWISTLPEDINTSSRTVTTLSENNYDLQKCQKMHNSLTDADKNWHIRVY